MNNSNTLINGIDPYQDFSTPVGADGISRDGGTLRYSNKQEVLDREQALRDEAVAIAEGRNMVNIDRTQNYTSVNVRSGPTEVTEAGQQVLTVMRGSRQVDAQQALDTDVVAVAGMTMTLRDAVRNGLLIRTANGGIASPGKI
jgi:hypothetical protein